MPLVVGDQPARIALTGAGGIGKTTVALAIMHDDRVYERFEDRRFFISCEAAIDTQDAARFLARTLSLEVSKDPLSDIVRHLKAEPRTLIVVDNLETIWINERTRSSTELFLRTLASIETVSSHNHDSRDCAAPGHSLVEHEDRCAQPLDACGGARGVH